jgi:endo-1,4-beta-mannosidase
MVQAVRAGGARQPVSIGDGAWGIEITGRENGFSVRELARVTDFTGPHVYPTDSDPVRQNLNAAFLCELAAVGGNPVVLEEFGLSSDWASEENTAAYYRQVLHTTLLAGATGWLAWNNTDLDDLADQDPYRHHPFEMHFGVTDSAGRPKAALRELRKFAATLSEVDFDRVRRADTDVALVVSSYLERGYPVTVAEDDRRLVFDSLRQAYVAAREADLAPGLTREEDGIADDALLYLLPSTRQLMAPTFRRLAELARDGATVYLSYCSGTHDGNRGPWFAGLDEFFGVRQELRYGLVAPILEDIVAMRFVEDFGYLRADQVLRFQAAGNEHGRAFLPVTPTTAEVLAIDDYGRPFLLRNRVGDGWAVLCTYPLEYMASCQADVNPEATYRLYQALAAAAGVRREATVDDPLVFADVLVHEDGRRFRVLVSQHDGAVEVSPIGRTVADKGAR